MQLFSSDKIVRSNTANDLKEFNNQPLATQAKKGEQLVSMMPAIKRAFDLLGDDIVDLSIENDALKNKIGTYDEQWLEKSKAKLLKQIDDEKRAKIIIFREKKQMEKKLNKWHTYPTTNFGRANLIELFSGEINYKT